MTVRFAVVRGVERINFSELGMYATLRKEGFEPELLCSTRSRVSEADVGMPIRRLSLPPIASRLAPTLVGGYLIGRVSPYRYYHQYLQGFHRAVRAVDVLCPVDLGHPTSYQSVRERRFGKKVVVQCWDNIPFNWPQDRPIREHYEAVLDGADHFLALTEDSRRTLRAMGVSEERISRVNIGVDVDFWRPDEAPHEERRPFTLLFVGRLDWAKGLHTVIEALDLVRAPVRLTVVGAGGQESRLRWLIESRQKRGRATAGRSVEFLGPRFGDELRRLRQSADAQVVPSIPSPQWREQLNQAMLEGLACGLPAIASSSGAIPEAVADRDNGFLVPPDSPVDWARAIDDLAEHSDDRRRMARRARERVVEEYALARQGHLLAAVLHEKVLGH
jgi:glycosyltransferase involved in cell wall biosynthesis